MIDISTLTLFFASIQSLPLHELILLYFVGYCLAAIIKNVLRTEVSTAFNFNKKVASGFLVFYFLLVISKFPLVFETFAEGEALKVSLSSVGLFVVCTLALYSIFFSRFFMKNYLYFYAAFIFISITYKGSNLRKLLSKTNFKSPPGTMSLYSINHFREHFTYHLPSFLICTALMFNMWSLGFGFVLLVLVLCFVFIATEFAAELKSKARWSTSPDGFGTEINRLTKQFF